MVAGAESLKKKGKKLSFALNQAQSRKLHCAEVISRFMAEAAHTNKQTPTIQEPSNSKYVL